MTVRYGPVVREDGVIGVLYTVTEGNTVHRDTCGHGREQYTHNVNGGNPTFRSVILGRRKKYWCGLWIIRENLQTTSEDHVTDTNNCWACNLTSVGLDTGNDFDSETDGSPRWWWVSPTGSWVENRYENPVRTWWGFWTEKGNKIQFKRWVYFQW